ncbi:histidine phosphatase family protein [Jatrophihabitans endophyticus]|uniref:histidine phosphatase family protein n=1 Tax=Jatrophihabitans endophyticus TaxID=1206085 RepID=UPI001A08E42C|nr:histidine phosphatase family protein [Jatrophihabitans endophyticus]MBE7187897.1 histidine phosphatase family protein [Jatrophihabitans endophyticus]
MSDAKAGPEGPAFGLQLDDDTALWIVRHGETEWSVSGRHTGSTDIPLTTGGEAQARALVPVLEGIHPALVLSSPSARALDTARLAGIQVDETTPDLAEWDYGEYEGVTTAEIHETVPDWNVFTHGCPGGESVAEVGARADRLLARLLPRLADGPVMVFGHGHFSRVLGARWIGLPTAAGANLLLGTAAPSLLGAEHGGPALAHWNLPNPAA